MLAILKTKFICEESKESFVSAVQIQEQSLQAAARGGEADLQTSHEGETAQRREKATSASKTSICRRCGRGLSSVGGGCVFRVVKLFLH